MLIIKAVIYFGICHLIVGQPNCNFVLTSRYNECVKTIPSIYGRIRVTCFYDALAIHVLDVDNAKPSSGHNNTELPSLDTLRNSCRNNTRGLDDLIDNDVMISMSVNNITEIPDNYFCNLRVRKLRIDFNLLHDTTKMGFSSLENCQIPCLPNLTVLRLYHNTSEKVSNNSFCGLQGLRHLSMGDCQLKNLESDAFVHLKSLNLLSLNYNNISMLPPGVFRQQQNTLTTLYLYHNKLNSSSILELKHLRRLYRLDLQENQVDVIPNGLFEEMSQLTYLNLENNRIKTLQGALRGLSNLESLLMSNNDISEIGNDDFKDLVKLKYIDLMNNPIRTFQPEALTNCVNMSFIIMASTSLTTVPNFILNFEELLYLDFQYLDFSNNKIAYIRVGTFDKVTNITKINLSYNQLTEITNIFKNCPAKILILDHNRITKISFNDFSFQLKTLSITHNHIHTMDSGFDSTDKHRWRLAYVEMSHNHLSDLNNLSLPSSMLRFDVSNNSISRMTFSDAYMTQLCVENSHLTFNRGREIVRIVGDLFTRQSFTVDIYLSGYPLVCSCEYDWIRSTRYVNDRIKLDCISQFQRLGERRFSFYQHYTICHVCSTYNFEVHYVKTCNVWCPTPCKCCYNTDKSVILIDCSSNNIVALPLAPTIELVSARELYVYLDNNTISKIHSTLFLGLNNTIQLHLNWTGLKEIADGSFDHLTVLKVLNLEHNNLRHISQNMFKNLNSLKRLFLSHNQLQTIEPNAFPSRLRTLYLDNNQLVNYSVWQLDSLWIVGVHANKWSCECDYMEKFQNWLLNDRYIVKEKEQLFCVQPNGSAIKIPLTNFNSSYCYNVIPVTNFNSSYCYNVTAINNQNSRHSNAHVWVLGIFVSLTIIIAIISALFYVNRNRFRSLINKFRF